MGLVNGTSPLANNPTERKHTMNKQTQSKVNTLVSKFLDASDDFIISLHSEGLDTPELQRPYVIVAVCAKYTEGKGWNESSTGKVMLDSKHERCEFLKTRVRDVMLALKGETRSASSAKADPVDAIIKAFNKLDAKQQKAVIKALA
jgi:ribosome-associated translation inhibitor RaiA